MEDLIINFTPTGMIPTKSMTPHVPLSPDEIVNEVLEACKIGITIVHLHVRNADESPSLSCELYKEIIERIREKEPELVVCVSCSGRVEKDIGKRLSPLNITGHLKPDMASLTLSSLNFNKVESVNSPEVIIALAKRMKENGIKPELEIFDLGMVNYMKYLIKKSIIFPPYYANIILGNISCAQANPLHFGIILNDLPEGTVWSVGGIGDYQLKMNAMSIICGGGVRVGLEDNVFYDENRSCLATNLDLVKRVHNLANFFNRKIMKSVEFRKIMGLKQ